MTEDEYLRITNILEDECYRIGILLRNREELLHKTINERGINDGYVQDELHNALPKLRERLRNFEDCINVITKDYYDSKS